MIKMVKEVVLLWLVALVVASHGSMVDDSNKSLTNILTNYTVNITHLILHNNNITMDSQDTQALRNYSNLIMLDLSYNLIERLPDGAFSSLKSLETLSLKGNKLQSIRNDTFADCKKLKTLDLAENPLNCTQELLMLMKRMNMGLQIGPNATCANPKNLAGQRILDVLKNPPTKQPPVTRSTATTTNTASTSTTVTASSTTFTTTQRPTHGQLTTISSQNISNKGTLIEHKGQSPATNTWKFLTGVILLILCTSMFIVCAVKSPIWYKMIFDYRHQRLQEAEEPDIFNTGRYSNFRWDTDQMQTETSAQELDRGLAVPADDDDGFIEDGYIQSEDYKGHVDIDEL